jgi:hypothetical protein
MSLTVALNVRAGLLVVWSHPGAKTPGLLTFISAGTNPPVAQTCMGRYKSARCDVPSDPKHAKAHKSLSPAVVGIVVQLACALILAGATLIAPSIGGGGSGNTQFAPYSRGSNPALSPSGSVLGSGNAPAPTYSPAQSPTSWPTLTPVPTSTHTAHRSHPTPHNSVSTQPAPASAPTYAPPAALSINIASALDILGLYLPPFTLRWTPTVTVGDQVVDQHCWISWTLYQGSTPIYRADSPCSGTFMLPFILLGGDYRLVGQAILGPDQYADGSAAIPVG